MRRNAFYQKLKFFSIDALLLLKKDLYFPRMKVFGSKEALSKTASDLKVTLNLLPPPSINSNLQESLPQSNANYGVFLDYFCAPINLINRIFPYAKKI